MRAELPTKAVREPSLADAVLPLVTLAGLIASALALFGLDALDGPIQVALVLCCAVVALIAMKNGHDFAAVQESGRTALSSITSAVFILLAVGALIGVWNLSGTIPRWCTTASPCSRRGGTTRPPRSSAASSP